MSFESQVIDRKTPAHPLWTDPNTGSLLPTKTTMEEFPELYWANGEPSIAPTILPSQDTADDLEPYSTPEVGNSASKQQDGSNSLDSEALSNIGNETDFLEAYMTSHTNGKAWAGSTVPSDATGLQWTPLPCQDYPTDEQVTKIQQLEFRNLELQQHARDLRRFADRMMVKVGELTLMNQKLQDDVRSSKEVLRINASRIYMDGEIPRPIETTYATQHQSSTSQLRLPLGPQ